MFLIPINELQGIELILKALRGTGCIASSQLADGIEKSLFYVSDEGVMQSCKKQPPLLKVVKVVK
jgi:hypothetical protein